MTETHRYYTGRDRPQTAKKLSILRKYFAVWLTIWSGDVCASWVAKRWHVIDLFAGTGQARGAAGEALTGSPLVFLEEIEEYADRVAARGMTVELTFIEHDAERHRQLEERVAGFLAQHPATNSLVDVRCLQGDANEVVDGLTFGETSNTPCFLFVDPFGLEIHADVMNRLVARPWKIDVLFNYMVEAARRVYGVAVGASSRALSNRETLDSYFGPDVAITEAAQIENPATYAHAIFTPHDHKVVAFRMQKPGSTATQYDLLFSSRHDTVIKVMRDVYAKEMTDQYGQTSLFGVDEHLAGIEVIE